MRKDSLPWRLPLILGGILIVIGGPQHPSGSMLEMLRDPIWFRSHAFILAGFVAITLALWMYMRTEAPDPDLRRWLRWGIAVGILQSLDYVAHTMAYVDAGALAAGEPTPVLTIHMILTAVVHPIYAIGMAGLLWVGQRAGRLGSPWINWIGLAGVVAHGLAGLLVAGLEVTWARVLFPFIILLALWCILAGLWPARKNAQS